MENLILGTIVFVLAFLGRFIIYLLYSKRSKKNHSGIHADMMYLVNKFKLDINKINTKGIAALISLLDAMIITFTLIIVINITDSIILEMILGLVILIVLIICINEIFGRILIKRGFRK